MRGNSHRVERPPSDGLCVFKKTMKEKFWPVFGNILIGAVIIGGIWVLVRGFDDLRDQKADRQFEKIIGFCETLTEKTSTHSDYERCVILVQDTF